MDKDGAVALAPCMKLCWSWPTSLIFARVRVMRPVRNSSRWSKARLRESEDHPRNSSTADCLTRHSDSCGLTFGELQLSLLDTTAGMLEVHANNTDKPRGS